MLVIRFVYRSFFLIFKLKGREVNEVREAESSVYLQGVFTDSADLLTLLLIPLQGLVIAKKAVGQSG